MLSMNRQWGNKSKQVSLAGMMANLGCRYILGSGISAKCLCMPDRGRHESWGGALWQSVPSLLQEGCKRYPCLFPPCPTLTLLHPGQAAKEWGVPWELDRTGRESGKGREGEAAQRPGFQPAEKEWNQIQAKSLSIYCIPHLSRAASWKEIRRGDCTMGLERTREER